MGTTDSKQQQQQSSPATKPPAKAPEQQPQQTKSKAPPPQQPVAVKKRQVQNNKANSTDMAILELKLQREKLKKATDKYYNLSEKMKQAAKDAMLQDPEKNKANAIYLIKRSKQYEQQIETTANQLLNLETSINAIEDGILQVQIMQSLESGAKALDAINQQLSRAEEVMDNVREAVATQKEISEILGAPVGDVLEQDEDELEAELNKIMGKTSSTTKTTIVVAPNLDQVKVPTHTPKKEEPAKVDVEKQTEEQQHEEEKQERIVA